MKTCEECKRFYDDNCKMEIEIEEILQQIWEDFFENNSNYEWYEFRSMYCGFYK